VTQISEQHHEIDNTLNLTLAQPTADSLDYRLSHTQTVSLFIVLWHSVETEGMLVAESHCTQPVAVHRTIHEVQL